MPRSGLDHEEDFRRLFAEHNRQVLAYALRRCEQRADAEDVVAGTFAVAWRRFADAPAEEFRLAWLYAIAARVLANQTAVAAAARGAAVAAAGVPAAPPERGELAEVLAALHELRPEDQEVLRLAAWEGLTNAELAVALGCSENAAAIRLHRARKRLVERLEKEEPSAGHSVVGDAE